MFQKPPFRAGSRDWVKPQPDTQLVLSDLYCIVNRLSEYYTPEEIRTWLDALHPQLDGSRAIDLVNHNRSAEVLRILDRLDSDVYLQTDGSASCPRQPVA